VFLIEKIKSIHKQFMDLPGVERNRLFQTGFVLFCLLLSYPLFRATTTSLLLSSYGAKGSPYAWIFSVIVLSLVVSLINQLQKTKTIHFIFSLTSLFTLFLFGSFYFLLKYQGVFWTYPLYILKEVYIVILVHATIGQLNASVSQKTAELAYGPIGAIGSLGGIVGAFLTSHISKVWSIEAVLILGMFIISLAVFIFNYPTEGSATHFKQSKKKASPISSVKGAGKYVFYIGLVVALSQFVINIGNYQFNIYLENRFAAAGDKSLQTSFLGEVYGWINLLSLLIQVVFIPFILKFIPHRLTHSSIPVIYTIFAMMTALTLGGGAGASLFVTPVVISFIAYKGMDYSIFSAAKELLYFTLTDLQKYGAKYIVDMIVYRLSKGIISVILILLPDSLINYLMFLSLGLWILVLIPLFKRYQAHHDSKGEVV
tara:strand:- start:5432 stop:6715 length:1284 start_codon:yes stop_codon:yes gene_type:complete